MCPVTHKLANTVDMLNGYERATSETVAMINVFSLAMCSSNQVIKHRIESNNMSCFTSRLLIIQAMLAKTRQLGNYSASQPADQRTYNYH